MFILVITGSNPLRLTLPCMKFAEIVSCPVTVKQQNVSHCCMSKNSVAKLIKKTLSSKRQCSVNNHPEGLNIMDRIDRNETNVVVVKSAVSQRSRFIVHFCFVLCVVVVFINRNG